MRAATNIPVTILARFIGGPWANEVRAVQRPPADFFPVNGGGYIRHWRPQGLTYEFQPNDQDKVFARA